MELRDLIQQIVEHVVVHPQGDGAACDAKHAGKRVRVDPVWGSEICGKLWKRLNEGVKAKKSSC